MRNRLLGLALIFACSILLVVGLFFNSNRINQNSNHFNRIFATHTLKEVKRFKSGSKYWYVASIQDREIFLSNRTYLNALLKINLSDFDTTLLLLDLPALKLKTPKIAGNINDAYILDGDQPAIYKLNIHNAKRPILVNNNLHFDEALPLGKNLFIVRFLNKKNEFTLGKLESNRLTEAPELLQGIGDGIMSKDGMLLIDNINQKIVYVHYYRNDYVVADYNMKLLYHGKTKDTVSIADINVGKPDKKGNVIMASPPVITNKLTALYNSYLFVNSALLADNEKKEFFNGSSVIDVYDIREGLYKFSFYIPDYKNKKIKEFNVFGDKLVAMFEDQCIIYSLNQKYFK